MQGDLCFRDINIFGSFSNLSSSENVPAIAYNVEAWEHGTLIYSNTVAAGRDASGNVVAVAKDVPKAEEVSVKLNYCSPNYNCKSNGEITMSLYETQKDEPVECYFEFEESVFQNIESASKLIQFNTDEEDDLQYQEQDIKTSSIINISQTLSNGVLHEEISLLGEKERYVRVKILNSPEFEISLNTNDTGVTSIGSEGYYYLQDIIEAGGGITIDIKFERLNKNFKQKQFNIIFIAETVEPQYDASGNPYVDWNYIGGTESGVSALNFLLPSIMNARPKVKIGY